MLLAKGQDGNAGAGGKAVQRLGYLKIDKGKGNALANLRFPLS